MPISASHISKPIILFAICALLISLVLPVRAQDAAPDGGEAMVRINRLENMLRQMQGQIEELQFSNQKLQEQLKFMSSGSETHAPVQGQGGAPPSVIAAPVPISGAKTADTPQSPVPQNNSGPINLLAAGKAPQPRASQQGLGTPPMTLEQAAAAAASGQAPPQLAQTQAQASTQPVAQKPDFEIAKDAIAAKDYEKAVSVLTGLVEGNPKEPKIPDALMLLGDAQYRLKRYPEAAQRYLKLAQTYPKHPEAPSAFVRLGLSLNEMGQKPQACATFVEFAKRYPDAKASAKAEAERGKKAASCG